MTGANDVKKIAQSRNMKVECPELGRPEQRHGRHYTTPLRQSTAGWVGQGRLWASVICEV